MIMTNPIDMDVFRRYSGISLPRHVSYPMPTWWQDAGADDAKAMREEIVRRGQPLDLSLYVHVPFCEHMCKFCACCRIVQRKDAERGVERVNAYVSALQREIATLGEQYDGDRKLRQIHWGGGTPTYLSADQIDALMNATGKAFTIADDAEISIEVDPRSVNEDTLRHLRAVGFNRISLGVQDFDAQVQEHVRRIQPYEMVRRTVDRCRELGFQSINFDLIYGLPYQAMDTVRDTLGKVIELAPDRVAYYHYAQIPEKIAAQRALHHEAMPDSTTKLAMFLLGVEVFSAAGYDFIGLDHFARSDELLSKAAREGTLQRNFQGMTTGAGLDLLGVGASSISHLAEVGFLQNVREPDQYIQAMNENGGALHRGKPLTFDDCVRQGVIWQIYCGGRIVPPVIEAHFNVDFAFYFKRELEVLRELEQDGLVAFDAEGNIDVTFPLGRVLMRNVAAVFDAYLDPDAYREGEKHCFSVNA